MLPLPASVTGVPSRLWDDARGAGEALREPWDEMGRGGCKTAGAESTGCIVGCSCPFCTAWPGAGGGGYSGARCFAEDTRFLTLLRRPVEPVSEVPSLASEFEPSEKSDESRWLERFVESIVKKAEAQGRLEWLRGER